MRLHRKLIRTVCLSLLGTWPGRPEEQWQPNQSTLLSVLISIQAMILNETPWENEPTIKRQINSSSQQKASDNYNRRRQTLTLRFAILDWLQYPNMRDGIWKDVVSKYFELNGDRILAMAERWAERNRDIRHYDGWTGSGPPRLYQPPMDLLAELEKALGRRHMY